MLRLVVGALRLNSHLPLTRAGPAPGMQSYASSSAVPLQQSPRHSVMLCWSTSQRDLAQTHVVEWVEAVAQECDIFFAVAAKIWRNQILWNQLCVMPRAWLEEVIRDLVDQVVQVLEVQEESLELLVA